MSAAKVQKGEALSEDIIYEDGGENVFVDIGVSDPEDSLLRAKLARKIAVVIQKKGLSQTQIAKILGVDQPKVSKLVRGRISGFTSDRLLRFLTALGCDVRIEIKERRSNRRRGKVVIAAA
jgi:predicted XRE-type DNA-binding protein